ncbi:hypothetical protein C8R44DRAFT_884860 [Mycena epipterygia]|nr:hypothetical protein C8R44DRAFT_884860 [Mycena epipterygia]
MFDSSPSSDQESNLGDNHSVDQLEFNPLGAYDLRRHLGVKTNEYARFNRSRQRFLASDISFLASGASEDGQHVPEGDLFFPELIRLYGVLAVGDPGKRARHEFNDRIRRSILDLATKWDRTYGGTTMILHVDGTTAPGTPLEPERLKAHCYLPPKFLRDHPETHHTIAFLVQTFIEQIGMPTVADWIRRAKRRWSLNGQAELDELVPVTALIPSPVKPGSAHYIFPGRPWGSLPPMAPAPAVAPPAVEADEFDIFDIDEITLDDALMDAVERTAYLEAENGDLREAIRVLEETAAESNATERQLSAEVSRLERELSIFRGSQGMSPAPSQLRSPTTPSRTRTAPPAYAPSPFHLGSQSTVASSDRAGLAPHGTPGGLRVSCTRAYLARHLVMGMDDAVDLVARAVPPTLWTLELRKLSDIPDDCVDGLVEAMDWDLVFAAGAL